MDYAQTKPKKKLDPMIALPDPTRMHIFVDFSHNSFPSKWVIASTIYLIKKDIKDLVF